MSEKPSWLPSDRVIYDAIDEARGRSAWNPDPIRALISTAVEKALSEQWKMYMEDRDAIVRANIRVQNLYSHERNEQEIRHKREVLSARIDAIESLPPYVTIIGAKSAAPGQPKLPVYRFDSNDEANAAADRALKALRSALAALDSEVAP